MGIDRPDDDRDISAAATGAGEVSAEGAIFAVDKDASARHEGAPDVAAGEVPDRKADVSDQVGAVEPDHVNDEDRYQYIVRYRATVDAVFLGEAHERWEEVRPGFAEEGRQHAREGPVPPRASPDIGEETFGHVERGCKEIYESEENIVTPVLARIEIEDPDRKLVGLEFRRKGQDRIMEKVWPTNGGAARPECRRCARFGQGCDQVHLPVHRRPLHAGVDADVDRLKGAGFEQRRVNAFVPVPRGALDYPDYP